MKKWLALTLAIIMVLSVVACDTDKSRDEKKPEKDKIEENKTEENKTEENKTEENKTEEKVEISRGKIKGDVYTNEFLGIEFTKPDSWVYATDEEIAEKINVAVDWLLGEQFKEALENNPLVYDMLVVDQRTGSSVSVGYENLSKTLSTNITVEQYVEAFKEQLAGLSTWTVNFSKNLEKAKLGNTEFTKFSFIVTVQDVSMKQVYYLKKIDGYMCFIIICITRGQTIEQIEAMFK
ncbi:MAG: hypothetical protein E7611_01890 [Ruminococcaceae bacterium]|nr:hypothetical protein [Oscillospiraceae bacterium]